MHARYLLGQVGCLLRASVGLHRRFALSVDDAGRIEYHIRTLGYDIIQDVLIGEAALETGDAGAVELAELSTRLNRIIRNLDAAPKRATPELPELFSRVGPHSVSVVTCDADDKGPQMPADWFRDKFGIPAERLRSARRSGRLEAENVAAEGKPPIWHYSVADAQRLWPDDGIYTPESPK